MKRLLPVLMLVACGRYEDLNENNGRLKQLSFDGPELASAGVPIQVRVERRNVGRYWCSDSVNIPIGSLTSGGGTSCEYRDAPPATVTAVVEASCPESRCSAKILDGGVVE